MFQPGHKLAPGGKRAGAGRPSKKAVDAINHFRATLERELSKKEKQLVNAYLGFAEADEATARHLVDKALPTAKQQLEISGGLKIIKVDAFDPDKE